MSTDAATTCAPPEIPEAPRSPTANNNTDTSAAVLSVDQDVVVNLLSDGESSDDGGEEDDPDTSAVGAPTAAIVAANDAGNSGRMVNAARDPQHRFRYTDPEESLENFPRQFDSWDEFESYMSEFCAVTYQPFRKRSSVGVNRRNNIIADNNNGTRPLPDGFHFYSMRFQCTHGRMPVHRGGGLRVRSALRHTGCTARLNATLKMDDRTQRYVVETKLADSHNHPIGKEHYFAYSENRQVTDPALLRVIEVMKARGESGKAILARLREIVKETTGEECLLTIKDVHNTVARLRKAKRIASQLSGEAQDEANGDQSVDDAASNSDSDSADTGDGRKRRRVDWASVNAAASGADITDVVFQMTPKKTGFKVTLSHLGVLLDASNCYNHIHNEVAQVGIAKVELLVGTLSGFKHEILTLSASSSKPEDVDFVVPQYVLHGCERWIVKYCHVKKVAVSEVGVRLEVLDPRSDEPRTVTLGARQLLTMKRFYLARQNVSAAKKAIDWVTSSKSLEGCQAVPPFDEYADYSKDLMVLSLGLLPLSSTIVGGISLTVGNLPMRFTDTIIGANLLKFVGADSNMDVDCAKAALLALHSRFYTTAAFLSPSFMLERVLVERCKQGSGYGAFLAPKRFVAGLVQLRSSRWGGVVLDCMKNVCFLFTTDAAEYQELQQVVGDLLIGFSLPGVDFVALPTPDSEIVSPSLLKQKNNSGILALLVVELVLQGKNWEDLGEVKSLDYYRMRYLLQAIQVVTKQNIHEIRWS